MSTWSELARKFYKIACDAGGPSKDSSGSLTVEIVPNMMSSDDDKPTLDIHVTLGAYDIGDWPRHLLLGPFSSEEEALSATVTKIEEARQVVAAEAELEPIERIGPGQIILRGDHYNTAVEINDRIHNLVEHGGLTKENENHLEDAMSELYDLIADEQIYECADPKGSRESYFKDTISELEKVPGTEAIVKDLRDLFNQACP